MRRALLQRLSGSPASAPRQLLRAASSAAPAPAPAPSPAPPPPQPAAHPAFTLLRAVPLPEQAAHVHLYTHTATGAQVLSVVCPSEREKVFGAAFLTVPGDDSGVAHVLEHSVLCGSARYPSKEPFVTLLASSLQTYLNAMTYPDRTVYPVASPNAADFYNLVRVYLDAVLSPRLGEWALAQEGWHLEVVEGEAAAAGGAAAAGAAAPQPRALRASGVVYNEMKGVYSNADSVHAMACDAALFPDTPYSRSSGGDPLAITALTPQRFAAFHAENYSPARARLWFFGDDPEAKRLEILEEFLGPLAAAQRAAAGAAQPSQQQQQQQRLHPDAMPLQAPFEEPRWVSLPYPASAQEGEEGGGEEEGEEEEGEEGEEAAGAPAPAQAGSGAGAGAGAGACEAALAQRVARPADPLNWGAAACTRAGYGGGRGAAGAAPAPLPAAALPNHFVTVNWCMGVVGSGGSGSGGSSGAPSASAPPALSPTDRLGLGILSHLLMGTQTATLRKALTDSGLGASVTGGGYDDGGLQATFAAGLKGVAGKDVPAVQALVLHALTMAAGGGFDAEHVAASLNTVEFGLREFSTGGGPRGLSLFLGSAGAWVHGRDPLAELVYGEALAGVKRELALAGGEGASTGYFARLVAAHLLSNPHRATLHSWPDGAWGARREGAERAWLAGVGAGLGEGGWAAVAERARELKRRQAAPDAPEDVARIPRLALSDVEAAAPALPYAAVAACGSGGSGGGEAGARPRSVLVTSQQATAGIGYLRCHIPLPHAPPHLLPLLPLLSWALTSVGTTTGKDEAALARAIGRHTGGLGASYGLWEHAASGTPESLTGIPHLTLAGKALGGKAGELSSLLAECALHANLDRRDRVVTYLRERISRAEAALVSSGHGSAGGVLGATSGGAGGRLALARDALGGLTALRTARVLLARIEGGEGGGWARVLSDLHELRGCVLGGGSVGGVGAEGGLPPLVSCVVGDASVLGEFQGAALALTGALEAQWRVGSGSGSGSSSAGAAAAARAAPAPSDHHYPAYPYPTSADELAAYAFAPGAAMGLTAADIAALPLGEGGGGEAGGRVHADYAIAVPADVSFVVKGARLSAGCSARRRAPLPAPAHAYALPPPLRQAQALPSSLEPPAALLRTGHLWERVRVSGGAYGAGVSLNYGTGGVSFHSYRDPRVAGTLADFDGAAGALAAAAAGASDAGARALLSGPVLSTIGSLDAPLSPVERGDKACARWLHGGSPELAQDWRDGVLGSAREDLLRLAEAAEEVRVAGRVAVVGGEAALGAWRGSGSSGARPLVTLRPLAKKA